MSQQQLKLKFIDASGYALSGKSAVLELLQEFDGYYAASRDCEFELLRVAGGLRDLESALTNRWNPISATLAISKFSEMVNALGRAPKLYDLNGQFNSFATKYDDRFHGNFTKISKEYIEKLHEFRLVSHVNTPYLFSTKTQHFLDRLMIKSKLTSMYKRQEVKFTVLPEKFYKLTRDYLDQLFNVHNEFDTITKSCGPTVKYDRYKSFVLSNCCEPYNASAGLNLFNNCKQIVVDRDPRDIYLFTKNQDPHSGFGHLGHSGEENIDIFIARYRYLRERSEPFVGSDRMLIHFEDIVLNYHDSVARIIKFLGEDSSIHKHKKKFFDPEKALPNVRLWKENTYSAEIDKIEKMLPEFCRDY